MRLWLVAPLLAEFLRSLPDRSAGEPWRNALKARTVKLSSCTPYHSKKPAAMFRALPPMQYD
jgi:hypothetical protein